MSAISWTVSGYSGAVCPSPHQASTGMITSHDSSPPPTMMAAIRGPRMKPTPNSAAEFSSPSSALRMNGTRACRPSGSTLSQPSRNLNSAPTASPRKTLRALAPPISLATSTSAQAVPSGYGSRPCSPWIRKRLSGTMNSTPSRPPHIASRVICSSPGASPQRKSAGRVKMTPLATELEAEPTVCEVLASSRLLPTPMPFRARKTATVITATGIEVEMVSPTRSPR